MIPTRYVYAIELEGGATLLLQRDNLFKPAVGFYRERVAPLFRISDAQATVARETYRGGGSDHDWV